MDDGATKREGVKRLVLLQLLLKPGGSTTQDNARKAEDR